MNTGIRHITTREMVLCAVMAAVTAVCAQISIPMPSGVPVTLQTFAVALTGYILGMRYGLISVAVYILLGAAGVPVFTGFRGGIGTIAGPTGGFIIGFLLMVMICGIKPKISNGALSAAAAIASGAAGIAACHAAGVIWFSVTANISPAAAFLKVSLPFILKDILSVILAYFISLAVKKAVKLR